MHCRPWIYQESRIVYGGVLELQDGSSFGLLRRERPHLLLDATTGAPTHLYTGVCPDGNVYGQMKQMRHCFTLVQAINGTAGC